MNSTRAVRVNTSFIKKVNISEFAHNILLARVKVRPVNTLP